MRVRFLLLGALLGALSFWGLSFLRGRATVYVEATPKNFSYALSTQTNTIDGVVLVPEDMMDFGRLVPVLRLPMRLYDRKSLTRSQGVSVYEFVKQIGRAYDFPIRWEPEPLPSWRKRDPPVVLRNFKDKDFFELLAQLVAYVQEMGMQMGETLDPNKISVCIVKQDGAVIKRVKTLTGSHPRVEEH